MASGVTRKLLRRRWDLHQALEKRELDLMETRGAIQAWSLEHASHIQGLEKATWQEIDIEHNVENLVLYPEFRMDSQEILSG